MPVRNWLPLGRLIMASTSLEDVRRAQPAASARARGRRPDVLSAAPPNCAPAFSQPNELALDDIFAQETSTSSAIDQTSSAWDSSSWSFWWLPPQAGLQYPAGWVTPYEIYTAVIYAFALVCAAHIYRAGSPDERRLLRVLATIGLTPSVVHALAYVEGRHRWGIEPLLLLLTGRGLILVASRVQLFSAQLQPGLFRWTRTT
jgi:hypothetical protein